MERNHPNPDLDANAQRDSLLAMPSFGKVIRVPSRPNPYIDFYPDLKGQRRILYAFMGKGFKSEADAELVRNRINAHSLEAGLREAVNQFRSLKTQADLVTEIVEEFQAHAPTMWSLKQGGEPYSARTLRHYRGLLPRAEPYFACMTMQDFFETKELLRFKEWFRREKRPGGAPPCPGQFGRGLKTDNEMVNCFAVLRAVVNYYQLAHPEFAVK